MDYNAKQLEDFAEQTKVADELKKTAIGMLSNIVTPDMEKEMSPTQLSFMSDAKILMTQPNKNATKNLEDLQALIKRSENII